MTTPSKLLPYRDEIAASMAAGETIGALAERLQVNRRTLWDFIKVQGIVRNVPAQVSVTPGPSSEEKLKARLTAAETQARKARTVDVQAELVLDEIRNIVVPAEPVFESPREAEGSGHPHMHVLLLSDLHIGEVVDREAMNGINEYNWEIAQRRMDGVLKAVRSFQNARPYPIDELMIGLLGDQNNGRNHEELAETNEFTSAEQFVHTGQLIGKFVEQLVEDYPRIHLAGVAGNHPRTTKTPANKKVFDNWDWASYKYAELYLSKYDSVTCNFPRSGMVVEEIAGKNALFFHGDGIRSTMPGVPWGGVMRRVNELKKQFAERGTLISYFALGHFHQANVVAGGSIWMNGSLKGPDEYTLKQFGAGDKPTQLLLTFDKTKERLTDVSFINPG